MQLSDLLDGMQSEGAQAALSLMHAFGSAGLDQCVPACIPQLTLLEAGMSAQFK